MTTRVLIYGAGALGSVLGHCLASEGHSVTLVGRAGYVSAVHERGLLLEVGRADHGPAERARVVRPVAVERMEDLPSDRGAWDLVLLTVKAYGTGEAARTLADHLPAQVPVMIVQNGVGGEELARASLGQTEIISGVVTLSVSVLAPAHVRLETLRGGLNLAPTVAGQDVQRWVSLFAETGLRVTVYSDHRDLKWSKLLLNIQANAIPAILDMSPAQVYASPALFALERAAFREALAVMRALRLRIVGFRGYPVALLAWAMRSLPATPLRLLLSRLIASGRGAKPPSLQIDLAKGHKRSEVRYLNGAVATYAERVGLEAPVNRTLTGILMGLASGDVSWAEFRGRPRELVAAVQAREA